MRLDHLLSRESDIQSKLGFSGMDRNTVSVLFNFEGLAFGHKRPKVGGAMSEPIALFRGSRTGDHE